MNQFIHMSTYARSTSNLKGSKFAKKGTTKGAGTGQWSARDVLAESMRADGAHPHVLSPVAPVTLFGDIQLLAFRLDALKPVPGVRKDTPILIAGVASSPWPPGDPRSKNWRLDVVQFLKNEFGENLDCVIGHDDEHRDHVHYYIAADDLSPVKYIHPALIAQQKAKELGGNSEQCQAAYVASMQAFQDRYNLTVALKYEQARIGPARVRVSRSEWLNHCQAETAKKIQASTLDRREVQLKKDFEIFQIEKQEVKVQKTVLQDIFLFLSDKIIELIPQPLFDRFATVFKPVPPKIAKEPVISPFFVPLNKKNTKTREESFRKNAVPRNGI